MTHSDHHHWKWAKGSLFRRKDQFWHQIIAIGSVDLRFPQVCSALLRQTIIISASVLMVITGLQSTRPLMSLHSNLIVHKQIFIAAQSAANQKAACGSMCKFYQTCTVHLNWRTSLHVNTTKLGCDSRQLLVSYAIKSWMIFTAQVVSASMFAGSGCPGKHSEMFGSGGCFCGGRVKWE